MRLKINEYCFRCKWRKSNKTCKESPRERTGDYDWCSAYKKSEEQGNAK